MATSNPNHYDLLILGCGEAGKYLAWTIASKLHQRCAVIERQWFGGSCPNVACLPSKNLIHSANVAHLATQGDQYGLPSVSLKRDGGNDIVQMVTVRERIRDLVNGNKTVHETQFKKSGAEYIWGEGKFIDAKSIELTEPSGGKRILTGENVVICTGSKAIIEDIPGLKEANPLTHVELLELDVVPNHLVIIGGGYVGLEFAQAMRRLGADVTVIEKHPRFLKKEDDDVTAVLLSILESEGIKFIPSTTITSVAGTSGDSVTLTGTASGKPLELKASHILCSTGRVPNNANIGLAAAGIALSPRGYVETDENLQTSVKGVFAVGDCAGSPHFTHIAFDDFRIVRDVLLSKPSAPNRKSGRQVPFTLFTSPELAHVGLREQDAKKQGLQYRISKMPMAGFLKQRTVREMEGFAKVLIAEDDTILGFTALGVGAGELLPVVQLAMRKGLVYQDIAELVITHPTLNEGLVNLFIGVPAK